MTIDLKPPDGVEGAKLPVEVIVELLRHHGWETVLAIGCAAGRLLVDVDTASLPAFGLDVSEWVEFRAGERMGLNRARVCDLEHDHVPITTCIAVKE